MIQTLSRHRLGLALLVGLGLSGCGHQLNPGAEAARPDSATAPKLERVEVPTPPSPPATARMSILAPAYMPAPPGPIAQLPSTAQYTRFDDRPWQRVAEAPVSTFSASVDTGSYANVRRFLNRGALPPRDAVRVEELVNYFGYDYAAPAANAGAPFAVDARLVASPWNPDRGLLRIAVKGQDLAKQSLPPANLVFLVDVSGSMNPQDRLPLVRSALHLLTKQLRPQDRVGIVSYASGTRIVLEATPGDKKDAIHAAIDTLSAGGGTYGEAGIRLAYAQARAGFIDEGINRVLLATDGDLNIGVTSADEMKTLVEGERKRGVSLTTLGVGDSNYNEALMKRLADVGDGSYHYLDTLQEAHKVLVNEMTSTLAVIAQDLKLQIEFNPALVQRIPAHRLRAEQPGSRAVQRRQSRRGRHRRWPHGDGAVRDHPDRCQGHGGPAALRGRLLRCASCAACETSWPG